MRVSSNLADSPVTKTANAPGNSLSPHPLLAVRTATAPFDGPHNIRSKTFDSLLQEHDILSRQIVDAKSILVQDLYDAVPRAKDAPHRHDLLQIKRKIANFIPVSEQELSVLEPEQHARVGDYCRDLRARQALLDQHREAIFQEFRSQLKALASDRQFCWAVNYSCPWLIDSYHRHGPGDNMDFSNEERGIYAYATRFFSKANPFHIFATIAFPSHLGLRVNCEYEVVVNISVILRLERYLLRHSNHQNTRFLYLRSF